jgi:HlyD family secretion protein
MRRLLGVLVLCAAALGIAFFYQHGAAGEAFITAPVERGTISTMVKATGTVEAVITVDVSSQLSGRIAEVPVNFNDMVKAGQVIARIDPEIYVARVKEARAALSVAAANAQLQKAALQRAKVALDNARTARKVQQAQLTAAQAIQEEAQRDFERNFRLSRSAAVSERDVSHTRAQRDAGAAGLVALEEQVTMKAEAVEIASAELSMAEANLTNAQAVVEQKAAAVEQAELDLQRTEIRSPMNGVILKRDVNPGQTVAVSFEAKTLFKIAQDLREMEVRGKIDEADVGHVQIGQTARFTVDAYPDRAFSGRVLQIRKSPEVVQNVVTYTAIISAPNPDLLLLPGMTAVLRIVTSDTGDTLKIPNQALRFRASDKQQTADIGAAAAAAGRPGTVWTLDDRGAASPVGVTLGISDENSTQVLGGGVRESQQLIVGVATPQSRAGTFGLRFGF